jgi:hypothetical protein
MFRNFNQK